MDSEIVVESPCISVCEIDGDTGFCLGCWRTREEIAIWGRADGALRLDILGRLHERRESNGGGRRRRSKRATAEIAP